MHQDYKFHRTVTGIGPEIEPEEDEFYPEHDEWIPTDLIPDEYDYPEDCSDPWNPAQAEKPLYPHYFKPCPYSVVDIYRVIRLFDVADPCIQHALKKLLAAGRRGAKDLQVDIQEAIDSLERWKAMATEDRIYNNKEVE